MLRGGENRGDADAAAFAPAADACACFVETTIRRAAPGDVDADLLLAVAARLLRGDASNARRAPRLVSLAAAILTRPSSAAAAALAPALEITAGRWAVEGGDARGGGGADAADATDTRPIAHASAIAPEYRAPLAAVHLAALRLRWRAFKAALRDPSPAPGRARGDFGGGGGTALERAAGGVDGHDPREPRGVSRGGRRSAPMRTRGDSPRGISRAARASRRVRDGGDRGARREATRRRRRGTSPTDARVSVRGLGRVFRSRRARGGGGGARSHERTARRHLGARAEVVRGRTVAGTRAGTIREGREAVRARQRNRVGVAVRRLDATRRGRWAHR